MIDVFNLALPFFGLIFVGYFCGKLKQLPDSGLSWMTFFLIYLALPSLFYRILSKTPFEQLTNLPFVLATTLATLLAFAISYGIVLLFHNGNKADATIAGAAGAYGNIGYMGPALALATLGAEAAVPVALIFCFDNALIFSLVPMMMAWAGTEKGSWATVTWQVVKKIIFNPFIIATAAGIFSAAVHFEPPTAIDRMLQYLQNATAPTALFVLGVAMALSPRDRLRWEVPPVLAVKLVLHPMMVLLLLSLFGHFSQSWVYTAVMMAALPPAINVFIMSRQYNSWVQQASGSILIGTLVSVFTLTTVMWMVKAQVLPYNLFR
jgi:hypothetical protein